jgi:integrase
MSIYRRGKFYWYRFMWHGKEIRESTKQGNQNIARNMESAHRTSLANGLVGIREKKQAPTLKEFCDNRFEPWAKSSFEKTCLTNWRWFRTGIRALLTYKPLANARLDSINNELAAEFASFRQKANKQISTVNGDLRVLRRALRLAVEWSVLDSAPVIAMLPGERHRERVVLAEEEQQYLDKAPELLKAVAIVLADTGFRPDECYRMRWEDLNWKNGRNGTVLVTHGKTASARRVVPMTPRVRFVLEARWQGAEKPLSGWVWHAPTKSGHVEHSSLKKQHTRAFKLVNAEIKRRNEENGTKEQLLRPWVLYSFRHTFLTRLGESGCDAWTLARIAGHSSIAISSRYVHPSEDAVLRAMSRLGGHSIGHTPKAPEISKQKEQPQLTEGQGEVWRARRDSNSRPNAPEAFALSS